MPDNIIVISDTHIGCQFGLCPDEGLPLDNGGYYMPSKNQKIVWSYWRYFWDKWVPEVTKGEPYIVVHNGDAIDGVHHRSVTQITQNLEMQSEFAEYILKPVVKSSAGYYHIRGTEAHVGKSAQEEERLARRLEAIPDENGNHARWRMWMRFGDSLINFTHHIGTTSSAAYESTQVWKELAEAYNEAGRWGDEPPDMVVRSHRHRHFEIKVASEKGRAYSLVTPGWQLLTPFTFRLQSGRSGTPQFGGVLIRKGEKHKLYTDEIIWKLKRENEVVV